MVRKTIYVLGFVLILVGILGFFNNPILGLFATDMAHSLVHLISGVLAVLFASQGERSAANFAKVFGIVYLLVAILGYIQIPSGQILGFITINSADNLLHMVLAAVLLYIGFGMSTRE